MAQCTLFSLKSMIIYSNTGNEGSIMYATASDATYILNKNDMSGYTSFKYDKAHAYLTA